MGFDQGVAGMESLRAVNQWIGIINSNLGGSNRTAYKSTTVSFGGGVPQVLRDPRTESNGIQVPDSSLTVDHTSVDFSQGTVVNDGELTHVAISGDGFFALLDTSNGTFYFTRDGDFHWGVSAFFGGQTILMNAAGLAVFGAGATFPWGTSSPQLRGQEIQLLGSQATFSVTLGNLPGEDFQIFRFDNNQALKFSKFGSTIFDASNAGTPSSVTDVQLVQSALESSNAALNDTLPQLSLAQKLFSAVSKIINVNNSDVDVSINLIK